MLQCSIDVRTMSRVVGNMTVSVLFVPTKNHEKDFQRRFPLSCPIPIVNQPFQTRQHSSTQTVKSETTTTQNAVDHVAVRNPTLYLPSPRTPQALSLDVHTSTYTVERSTRAIDICCVYVQPILQHFPLAYGSPRSYTVPSCVLCCTTVL